MKLTFDTSTMVYKFTCNVLGVNMREVVTLIQQAINLRKVILTVQMQKLNLL